MHIEILTELHTEVHPGIRIEVHSEAHRNVHCDAHGDAQRNIEIRIGARMQTQKRMRTDIGTQFTTHVVEYNPVTIHWTICGSTRNA